MSHESPTRAEELACDAALFGEHQGDADEMLVDELELLAGEVAAAAYAAAEVEVLPPALAARIAEPQGRVAKRVVTSAPTIDRVPDRQLGIRRAMPWLLAAAAIVVALVGWTRAPKESPQISSTADGATDTALDAGVLAVAQDASTSPSPSAERERLLALAGTSRIDWKPTAEVAAKGATGDVVWHNGVQRGVMSFRGLRPNDPATTQYQLWIFDDERDERYPVDGGVFDVGPTGEVLVPIAAKLRVGKPKLFAITVEKPGGVVVSKREHIVLVAAVGG